MPRREEERCGERKPALTYSQLPLHRMEGFTDGVMLELTSYPPLHKKATT